MADGAEEPNPAEQLIELLLYAPIGLIYEYQEVLPKLIKRGKSQVQLARVIGQMAANRGQTDPSGTVADLTAMASSIVARAVTEIGTQIGLAPEGAAVRASDATPPDPPPVMDTNARRTGPLPIARYDELTAREIIPLLQDLTPEQRQRVSSHEKANRNRKTVLAKLDRLEQ